MRCKWFFMLTAAAAIVTAAAQERIAFTVNEPGWGSDYEIYSMNPDGTDDRNLTMNPTWDEDAAWSPDMQTIAFTTDHRPAGSGIFLMNADGSDVRFLTEGQDPAWSPDGSLIAYLVQNKPNGSVDLYVMNADGTKPRKRTVEGVRSQWVPTWSPDGLRIAFMGYTNVGGIYVMSSEGDDADLIAPNTVVSMLDWSPDGRFLLASVFDETDYDIYRIDADGGNLTLLTSSEGYDKYARWSPDGRRIAFHSTRWDPGIWVMDADGSTPQLVYPTVESVLGLSWGGRRSLDVSGTGKKPFSWGWLKSLGDASAR